MKMNKSAITSKKQQLEKLFQKRGFTDFKWIDPQKIIVAQWVRMKCIYGCKEYGKAASCPPNVPSVEECRRFFKDYRTAAVFHFTKKVKKPEDRFKWTRKINLELLKLEREVFLSGNVKAFLLPMDSCNVCTECSAKRIECKNPRMGRPGADALAMDVFLTVRQYGYHIEVCKDYKQEMNRFAFLFIE